MSTLILSNDLSRPLLGSEPARDEEYARPTRTTTQEEEEEEPCCQMHSNTWWDAFILWMLLPALLFAQFGIAFGLFSPPGEEPAYYHNNGLQWSTVKYGICLFALSAYIFRRSILESTRCCDEDSSGGQILSSAFLLLWPEITMDFILFLLLFGQVCPAFFVMVLCTVAQSLYVVARSFHLLLLEDIAEEDYHDWE